MAMVVRPEQGSDFASIDAVVSDAFGDHWREVALPVERIRALRSTSLDWRSSPTPASDSSGPASSDSSLPPALDILSQ